jgi:hypothetical protein
MEPKSPNPYVFIVGCPRSGTTLTERLLNAHPQIAVTHETRWIPDCFTHRRGVTEEGLVEPRLVTTLLEHKRFPFLEITREELEQLVVTDPPIPYATFVSRLLDLYGRARGKRLVGDKTPRYARCIGVLHELWPRARFIHVIRDGRDVYLSAKSWISEAMLERYPTWREHPALSAGLWWTRNVRMARESAAMLDPALYHEVRYEALVADPARECAALCAFLDVPYEAAMLRFHERSHNLRPASARPPGSRKRLPVTRGLRDWRSELSEQEVRQFEATGGDLLDELGYERSPLAPDEGTLLEAAQVRDAFAAVMHRRVRQLPQRW